jgi:hypothetical protein
LLLPSPRLRPQRQGAAAESKRGLIVGLLLLLASGPPTIRIQPADTSKVEGTTALFSVVASDATRYQWQRSQDNGATFADVTGATSASYTTPLLVIKQFNGNLYRVIVGNSVGSVTSRAALLTVTGGGGPE